MADIQNTRISDYSFRQGLTLLEGTVAEPLAPSVRPMGLDAVTHGIVDERTGSQSDREWMAWVQEMSEQDDPELLLPGPFAQAFDLAREEIRQWLVSEQAGDSVDARTLRQCQRLLSEVRANLDLVHYYVNAVFKG